MQSVIWKGDSRTVPACKSYFELQDRRENTPVKVTNIAIGSRLFKSLETKLLILPTRFFPFLSPAGSSSAAFDGTSWGGALPLPLAVADADADATSVLEPEVAE